MSSSLTEISPSGDNDDNYSSVQAFCWPAFVNVIMALWINLCMNFEHYDEESGEIIVLNIMIMAAFTRLCEPPRRLCVIL